MEVSADADAARRLDGSAASSGGRRRDGRERHALPASRLRVRASSAEHSRQHQQVWKARESGLGCAATGGGGETDLEWEWDAPAAADDIETTSDGPVNVVYGFTPIFLSRLKVQRNILEQEQCRQVRCEIT